MRLLFKPLNFVYLAVFCVLANCFPLIWICPWTLIAIVPALMFIYGGAGVVLLNTRNVRLRICYHGALMILIFTLSVFFSLFCHAIYAFLMLPDEKWMFIGGLIYACCLEIGALWVGIVCIYCTSIQIGIKLRVLGVLFSLIPPLNLLVAGRILYVVMQEIRFETEKQRVNDARKADRICETKYPILLVHGLFMRDSKVFNYWGRIPRELKRNGATIYYGEHQSALSVEGSAKEIEKRIRQIIEKTGCEKLNIIAHSKGGLDCRYAISELGVAPYVASLTTISTPHRGCLFADRLLYSAPRKMKARVEWLYNTTMRNLGDHSPDFMAAANDLTAVSCAEFNLEWETPEGIFCQSFGSRLNKAKSGRFPMNLAYQFVNYFDGDNDGMVGEFSFKWGEVYQLITVSGRRGVSHTDMIDMNRENIKDFDVREFYVQLVNDLKKRGL